MTSFLLVLFATTLPNVSPSANGLPGAGLVTQLLSWLLWLAIACVLAMLFVNAARLSAANKAQNFAMHTSAKQGLLMCGAGALVLGVGQALIYGLYGLAAAAH